MEVCTRGLGPSSASDEWGNIPRIIVFPWVFYIPLDLFKSIERFDNVLEEGGHQRAPLPRIFHA